MIDLQRIHGLLTKVPRPPEDPLPEGVSDADCDAFVRRTGLHLPPDVRSWLKLANGPCVGPGGLFGIKPSRSYLDIEGYLKLFPSWVQRHWLPIAGDGSGGYYVIPTADDRATHPIYYVDSSSLPDKPSFIVASDIGHFLIFLFERELGERRWPFDKAYIVSEDPGILNFPQIHFPWDN